MLGVCDKMVDKRVLTEGVLTELFGFCENSKYNGRDSPEKPPLHHKTVPSLEKIAKLRGFYGIISALI